MRKPILTDAFGHHNWATLQLIDACRALEPAQLETTVPGTFGTIIDTLRHLVGADCGYLSTLSRGHLPEIEADGWDLERLRARMEANGPEWIALLADAADPDVDVIRHRDDGTDSHAPLGVRLAQAVHHGTDHRSQVCTALTTLGVVPPEIDVWDFAAMAGRTTVTPTVA